MFAGPDGKGVKAVVKDYTNTKKCDYKYDRLIGTKLVVSAAQSVAPAAAEAFAPVAVAKTSSGTGGAGRRRRFGSMLPAAASPPPAQTPAASPLAGRLSALPDNHRLYLVLNDFKANAQPETLYRVYLDLPDSAPSDPLNSNYVGSFNFFAAVAHGDDHDHADTARTISFDITDIAADLDARGQLKAEHAVTIVPAKSAGCGRQTGRSAIFRSSSSRAGRAEREKFALRLPRSRHQCWRERVSL